MDSSSSAGREMKLSSSASDVQHALDLSDDQWRQFEAVTRTFFQRRYEQYLAQERLQDIQYDLIPDSLINSIRVEIQEKIYRDFNWAHNVDPSQLNKAMTWKFRKSAKNKRDKLRRISTAKEDEAAATGSRDYSSHATPPASTEGSVVNSVEGENQRTSLSPAVEGGSVEVSSLEHTARSAQYTADRGIRGYSRAFYDPVRDATESRLL